MASCVLELGSPVSNSQVCLSSSRRSCAHVCIACHLRSICLFGENLTTKSMEFLKFIRGLLIPCKSCKNACKKHKKQCATFEHNRTLFVIVFYRMESGDCNGLRPRMRIIPEMPAFPDLKSPIVMEGSQAEERQGFGDLINSNGENK